MGLSNLFLLLPVTGLLITATLLGFIFWHLCWKLMNAKKDLEGKQYEEKLLPQDLGNKVKPRKWQVDDIHEGLTLIVDEIDSLHQLVSSLENTVRSLGSREDIRLAAIIRSMDYIYANSEKIFKGRKTLQDLPSNGSLDHIPKSNDYLQGYQHVVDILEPACDVNLTTLEDELLKNLKQGMMQMINQVEYLMAMLDELINLPQLNLTTVITSDHEGLVLMRCKLANLHKEVLSVEKSIESLYCKKDVSFAGVKFLFNFLGEATRWPRLRTLDTSIMQIS